MFGHQDENTQQPGQPQQPAWQQPSPAQGPTIVAPVQPVSAPSAPPVATPPQLLEEHAPDGYTDDQSTPAPVSDAVGDNILLDIKQQALQQLSPLVGQLEQQPEEKFRTTMMMIQASDNRDLIAVAYEAAQQITDEKAKAQALLDIVNEINYFTQH